MAPRSQEPQVETKEIDYIGTISFSMNAQKINTTTYKVLARDEFIAESEIRKLFEKDFPFDGLTYKITIAPVTSKLQTATSSEKKQRQIKEYLDCLELKGNGFKTKFNGKLQSVKQIKESLGFEINKKEPIPVPQMPTKKVETKVTEIKDNDWFCVYNIKIGEQKFQKGTKIEKVDNEIEARKQLDLYIKKNFSRVRSITKVVITKWNGETDFSNEIIEKALVVSTQPKLTTKKSIEELIKENFSEEELNEKFIQIVLSTTKPRARDFDDNFMFFPDNGETDDELFEKEKREIIHIKRKNFAVKRVNKKNLLVTKKIRSVLDSQKFRDYVENRPENDDEFHPWTKILEIYSGISKADLEKLQAKAASISEEKDRFLNKSFFNKRIG